MESDWHDEQATEKPVVTAEDIAQVLAMWTGIPVSRLAEEASARLPRMEAGVPTAIHGQE